MTSSLPASDVAQSLGARAALRDLAALTQLLDQGWQIEAPVLARLSWAQQRTGELAFHIILSRASQRSLVVIADTPESRSFLTTQDLPIL
jgi:hypothetical protein